MAKRDTDFYHFSKRNSQASLKAFVHKRLLVRLVIAGVLISLVLATAVYFIEFNRLVRLVNLRASVIVERFNDEIRPFLGTPSAKSRRQIRQKLAVLLAAGRMNLGLGTLIFAGIYDLDGKQLMVRKDKRCAYMDAVDAYMQDRDHGLPADTTKTYASTRINGTPHILLTYSLTNSQKEPAAVIRGIFALSAAAINDVHGRIIRSAVESIGIVVLTTLILYPIIMTLIGRLSNLAANLLRSNIEILRVLGSAIAKRDSDTDIHNYRVTIYSVTLAEAFGLDRNQIRGLIKGAFLHDVGKIGISDRILLKPSKLTASEIETMKGHVNHGIDIVKRSDWLKDATEVVGYHHERFDGKGYPHGLTAEKIPINARIFSIADVFDALTSSRPYKSPLLFEEAMTILEEGRGRFFDPVLLDTFLKIAKSLYDQYSSCDERILRDKLESITKQYFSN